MQYLRASVDRVELSNTLEQEQGVGSAFLHNACFVGARDVFDQLGPLLSSCDVQLHFADHFSDAVQLVAEKPVDLVFISYNDAASPVAFDFMRLKTIRPLACVAVHLGKIGEHLSGKEVLRIIRLGADDCLEPPFDMSDIRECLEHCREKLQQRRAMHETIEALRQSEEQFQEFAVHLDQAFWLSDEANERCLYVSPAYEKIFGRSCESLYENTYSYKPLILEEDVEQLNAYIEERRRGRYAEVEYRIRHQSDGSIRWIRSRAFPIRNERGELSKIAGITEDITDKKRLEEELLHTQKMQAIGALAGGIAHDFNNLLTPILGYSDLLTSGSLSEQRVEKAAETIRKAAHRAMELTKQLLGFARKGKHQHLPVDVHSEIDEVVSLVRRTFDKRIIIETRLGAEQHTILGDPNQVHQVLLNLALNARDALAGSESGRLRFETSMNVPPDVLGALQGGKSHSNYLCVTVTDTGCGIERTTQHRIFEPFFSTKPRGEGSGMGLAMVYGIVRNHGGVIEVESEAGQGAAFRIYFPLADREPLPMESRETEHAAYSRSGLVLLVDDEESVREIAGDLLEHLGYQVLFAKDGMEAISIYKQHHADISFVILDMLMPRLGGHDCFRKLKEINPQVVALLSTGYDLNNSAQKILDEGVKGFIQKPYTLEEFAEITGRFHPSASKGKASGS